jgi:hypothetical protein
MVTTLVLREPRREAGIMVPSLDEGRCEREDPDRQAGSAETWCGWTWLLYHEDEREMETKKDVDLEIKGDR